MYKGAIVTKEGNVIGKVGTKDELETWILEQDDLVGVKTAYIINQETKVKEKVI